jgi:peptidylprolyl isomerase
MKKVRNGDKVRVHYTGRLDDGTIFDTSQGREPLTFVVGKGQLIKGFEDAVIGMEVGEKKTVKILSKDAYGPHREELVLTVPRKDFPPHIEPREGLALRMREPDGDVIRLTIKEVTEDTVTLDANHPLAGQDLTFEIEMMEIVS